MIILYSDWTFPPELIIQHTFVISLLFCFPGGLAVSEGGQCSPSSQHQEGRSSPPPQLLRSELSQTTTLWWGITQEATTYTHLFIFCFKSVSNRSEFLFFFLLIYSQSNFTPAEISQWTNHRVMEWLRSVDLAEYAPNLRGSGVHGGLMVRGAGVEYSLGQPDGTQQTQRGKHNKKNTLAANLNYLWCCKSFSNTRTREKIKTHTQESCKQPRVSVGTRRNRFSWVTALIVVVHIKNDFSLWPLTTMLPKRLCLAAGVGASLQRGSARPPAQHSSQQNPAETPPGNTLPPAHRLRGAAAQTGLSGKPRLHRPHRHRQGQGSCPSTASQTNLCYCHCGDSSFTFSHYLRQNKGCLSSCSLSAGHWSHCGSVSRHT